MYLSKININFKSELILNYLQRKFIIKMLLWKINEKKYNTIELIDYWIIHETMENWTNKCIIRETPSTTIFKRCTDAND